MNFECPQCTHTADFDGDPAAEILSCSECNTRISYGKPMPRVVVQPSGNYIEVRIGDGDPHLFDHEYASLIGKAILSICKGL